jgi:Na+/H+-dicarboxylate symporter
MRTAVNVFSDSCCAVMVARTEGETGLYQQPGLGESG